MTIPEAVRLTVEGDDGKQVSVPLHRIVTKPERSEGVGSEMRQLIKKVFEEVKKIFNGTSEYLHGNNLNGALDSLFQHLADTIQDEGDKEKRKAWLNKLFDFIRHEVAIKRITTEVITDEISNPETEVGNINEILARKAFAVADVSGLKALNDLAGHETGDIMLATVANFFLSLLDIEKLSKLMNPDTAKNIVERLKSLEIHNITTALAGGDEFLLLFESKTVFDKGKLQQVSEIIQEGIFALNATVINEKLEQHREKIEQAAKNMGIDLTGQPLSFVLGIGFGVVSLDQGLKGAIAKILGVSDEDVGEIKTSEETTQSIEILLSLVIETCEKQAETIEIADKKERKASISENNLLMKLIYAIRGPEDTEKELANKIDLITIILSQLRTTLDEKLHSLREVFSKMMENQEKINCLKVSLEEKLTEQPKVDREKLRISDIKNTIEEIKKKDPSLLNYILSGEVSLELRVALLGRSILTVKTHSLSQSELRQIVETIIQAESNWNEHSSGEIAQTDIDIMLTNLKNYPEISEPDLESMGQLLGELTVLESHISSIEAVIYCDADMIEELFTKFIKKLQVS